MVSGIVEGESMWALNTNLSDHFSLVLDILVNLDISNLLGSIIFVETYGVL